MKIQDKLIKIDNICDYIPAISSASNITDLFQKCIVIPLTTKQNIENNNYYKHLQQKSFLRCTTLLIPVLGNIVMGIIDFHNREHNTQALTYSNKIFMLKKVQESGETLEQASDELRSDKEVVLAAVNQNGNALEHASDELRGDKEVVLAAVNQNGNALEHASDELRNDKEVVVAATNQNVRALHYASEELRGDKEFVLAVFSRIDMRAEARNP